MVAASSVASTFSLRPGRRRVSLFLSLGLLLGITACSRPPAVEQDHLSLVASLRTALSARNAEWLAGVSRAVEQHRADGKMSSDVHAHFRQLIEQAQSGQWEAAERACLDFERAQLNRPRPAVDPAATP